MKQKQANKYITGCISLITAGSILLSGCSKNFTTYSDALIGQPPATDFWKNATAATAASAVTAMYGNLRTWNNTAFAAIAVESMGSDDAVKGSTQNDATFMNLYDNFQVTGTEGQLDGFWQGEYQNINFCNQVLDNLPAVNMDAGLKARYLGEAKFVRAYSYFRLEPDLSLCLFNDPFAHCQSQTSPGGFGGEIRDEDLIPHFLRYSFPVILYTNKYFV